MKFINKIDGNVISASEAFIATLPNASDYEVYVAPVVEEVVLPITDITVENTRYKVGDEVTFSFTTELPNDTYYMPYKVKGEDRIYLKENIVVGGIGALTFNFKAGGIYYIDKLDIAVTELRVNGSIDNRFTIYVAE